MSATVTLQPSTRHALHSSFSFSNSSGSNYRPSTSSSSPLSSPSTLPFSAPALLDTLRTHYKHVHFPPALSLYTADLFSAARNHPQLDGVLLGYRAKTDANSLIAAGRVLGLGAEVTVPLVDEAEEGQQSDAGSSGFGPQENDSEVHVLDVSAADVARIVPRVISHRVRVRDGPEDEVLGSAVFSAVEELEPGGRQEIWERSTVKDILVQILADV
jgi:hypothetical protein